ncbi:DUF885 domain-containing protein [Pseudoalteromonas tunicata]|uniref:DUF885 domain-containing protein n=1 Tax=Pseudoalteromonas tunicata TaxID=314281 RepID=UPI00273D107F|nr:DUF885 domain-containing protein [Pseudoalteromonas tunicata]MDP5215041.1 DUF885 domain-containing protein [Pseudoalteromonas tunicata]
MNKKAILALAISAALVGCVDGNKVQETSQTAITSQSQNQQLENIVEAYFDEALALSPISATFVGEYQYNDQYSLPINAQNRAKQHALTQKYLTRIAALDADQLTGQSLLTFEIFQRDLRLAQEQERFPSYLIPIDQMNGEHNTFAGLGSGQSAQPFNTVEDYSNFIKRAEGFVVWLTSVEESMREGIKQGVVLPKVLAVKLLPQFQAHVVDDVTKSVFWMPVAAMPDTFSLAQKQQIEMQYSSLISKTLVPAYQKMSAFLENEYIPNSRSTVGYSDLPNGKAWYDAEIKSHTTLALSADEIHKIGLQEVERILGEMRKVKQQVGFEGDLAAFFNHLRESDEFYFNSAEEVIAAYEAVKAKIDARVPLLFEIAPKADYEVKAVEAFRAESAAGASYQSPAPDGSRPGIFYINTHNLKAQPKFILETLSIHEAAPGHHFQVALQQEVEGLPRIRKFGGYTVFEEGWALYAESLGKELGLFTDPYQWYGRLVDEQLRAMRLVLDTGLHAKGWTREQGIEFMMANSSMAQSDIISEVERYIAMPGQALSYKLGQFKIRELRDYCAKELGEQFDVKKFHSQILIDGALPMPILEQKIKRWVAQQQG